MPLRALLLLLAAGPAAAADWPQWRGPNRDGKSADTGLLAAWPAGGPKLAWELDNVGAGYGQVAVVGDKVYLIGSDGKKKGAPEFVLCLSAADGKEQWRTPLGTAPAEFLDGWGGGPRATPTVAGGKLFALGASGDLVCLDAGTGKERWKKNLVSDFGGRVPQWGYSESPLVDGDKVVVTPGDKGGMVALKADTGELAWKCEELKDGAGYSAIMPADVGGVRVYVQQTNSSGAAPAKGAKGKGGRGDPGRAVIVRAADGKLLFSGGELARTIAVIPTPVVAGDLAFFTAGYGAGCELFQLAPDGMGGVTATLKYTKNKVMVNHHGGVIEHNGYIYGHCEERGGGSNSWVCFDYKKGSDEPVWSEKKPGKGSIAYADGHFYLYSESSGELVRIKATPDGYQAAGRFTIPKKSELRKGTNGAIWPHPAIANGKLYLRDYERLFVYDLTGPAAGK
jgi:outer membrane protein assembly factor BamB